MTGWTLIVFLLCIDVLLAFWAASIAARKGLSAGGYFLAGLLLALIGVMMALIAREAPDNDAGDLERLAELHRSGVLTDDEFTAATRRLLGGVHH